MTRAVDRAARAAEWRRGWPVTLSASVGMAVSVMHLYSLGVFIEPLERAFSWKRAEISAGLAIVSVIFVLASPLVGMLLDRLSARAIAVPGLVIYCVGLGLLGITGPSIWTWWGAWLVIAIGSAGASATVWTIGVARLFTQSRGLALAVTLAGTGICSAVLPGFVNALVERFGWRGAYATLAFVAAVIALPLVLMCFKGDRAATSPAKPPPVRYDSPSARDSLMSPRFWRLGLASLMVVIGCVTMVVHFVPMVTERGVHRDSAVMIAGLIGVASTVGRIGTGFLLDRVHGRVVGAVTFAAPAVVCVVLLQYGGTPTSAIFAAIGLGLALGGEMDVVAYLTTRYFGLTHYGVLFGVINALLKVGSGVGPFLGGIMYDRFDSYTPLIAILILTFAASAALMLSLGKYPDIPQQAKETGLPVPQSGAVAASSHERSE